MLEVFHLDKELKKAKIGDVPKLAGPFWIDSMAMTKEEAAILGDTLSLHPLTVEDLLHAKTRIKAEQYPDYMLFVFYAISWNKVLDLIELDFLIGKNFILTNHPMRLKSTDDLKENKERLAELLKKGPDFMFHHILDLEVDNYLPVLERIDDEIEEIEETVTKKPEPRILTTILGLKRTIVFIKRTAFTQRDKISFIAKGQYPIISAKALPYFRDVYDHTIRVSDMIDNYREAVGNTFDVYMSAVSNSMNEVMKVLSIIATIALPLTVISGIFGTNFNNLPGQAAYWGFWVMILFMVLLSLGMILYFRRKKWF
ncbi:MAG: magnesium/cobalt transporter CorA [Nanoarchaeota archaeon]|nr:magnesium/cobalt transporter CorA [Nanoarchaeota archaeon]